MNFGELKTKVAVDCLGRTDSDTLDRAGDAVNWVLTEHLPFKGLKPFLKTTLLTTTIDREYVDLPTDFAGLKIAQVLQDAGDYYTMSDLDWEDTEVDETGEPHFKLILPSATCWRLYMRLIPDAAYTVKIWYYAKEAVLAADGSTPVLSVIYGDTPIVSGAAWRLSVELGLDADATKWDYIFNKIDLPELLQWQSGYHVQGIKRHNYNRSLYK